jgi:hypothetical protein
MKIKFITFFYLLQCITIYGIENSRHAFKRHCCEHASKLFCNDTAHCTMRMFFRKLQQEIQHQGKTKDIISAGIDAIVNLEIQGSIPIEESIDIFFQETCLHPNDTITGCFPHFGGCNYSLFQLIVLSSLFTNFHNEYTRMVKAMMAHGADADHPTLVQRGIQTEQTSANKELLYWLAFTNRHALRAEDEIVYATTEEQKQKWLQDKIEAEKSNKFNFHEICSY